MNFSINKKNETWIAVTVIAGLILAAFWKLALMKGLIITDDIFASDIMNEGFPYRFSLSEALKSQNLPLWIREIYGGFPLLARAEAGVCYPLNLILFGFFSPYAALNAVIVLTIITSGIGAYLYVREIGGSMASGMIAGIGFSFSGYLMSHLKHLSNVNAACWLPLGLLFIERAIRRNDYRGLLWFGLVFGMQHLSGHTQITYYSGIFYIIYFAFRYMNNAGKGASQNAVVRCKNSLFSLIGNKFSLYFIGMLILGSLLGAIQLIPTYELVSLSQRAGGVTFQYAANYAYDAKNFWTFFYPYINGDIGNATYTGNSIFWEDYGYVGIITLLLAFYGGVRGWKSWYVKFFTIAAVASYILVLGPNTPFYEFFFNYVPGMKYFRFPTRFLMITDFSLVILAAIGLNILSPRSLKNALPDKEIKSPSRYPSISLKEAAIVVLVSADLLHFQMRQNPIVDADKWMDPPKIAGIIKSDSTVFRMFCVGGNQAHMKVFEEARGWEGDLQPYIDQREFIQPSTNVLYGISSPNGYANLTPNYVVDIWGDQNRAGIVMQTASIEGDEFSPNPLFWKLMRMYNVKYLTSMWKFKSDQNLILLGIVKDVYFYRNSDFLPRAYFVGNVLLAESREEALTLLSSDKYDPDRSVILGKLPSGYSQSDRVVGNVDLTSYAANEAEFEVRTERSAILVFSDTYYPGWSAEIDGTETEIYQANITQRAIAVPAGYHKIRFEFKPKNAYVAFLLSAISIIVFIGLFFTTRKTDKS